LGASLGKEDLFAWPGAEDCIRWFLFCPFPSLLISTEHPKHQKEGRSKLDQVVFDHFIDEIFNES
jgi:hypothetical protein